MKISVNWLREFVELPPDTAGLCELLTLAGVEVEGVQARGVDLDKVVVAQIFESAPHPNADRLSVCKVGDGGNAPRQVVCGAKNYKVGDKVPLAQPGAVLPGDFKIKVGKLRGVESEGMLCSAKELGLGEGSDGLLILPQDAPVGASLEKLFPPDTILDLEITPNRADLLSHAGIAREVAALTRKKSMFALQPPPPAQASGAIEISTPEKCAFYSARKISGVKVAPSPAWLREKLEAVGIRSINNVVDVTNFAMLEMGQPLHAFDADKLGVSIRVRAARDGEQFLALDGRTYKLGADDLVIADGSRVAAIAGVMGGEETSVTESTKNLLLESALFQPASVRRTARKLQLASDSSHRFERGVDPAGVLPASQRATDLILELAGGVAEATVQTAGTLPDARHKIEFRAERCEKVLGVNVPPEEVSEILSGFGLEKSGDFWVAPSFRQDLTREIDLIEEVSRVFGIENIPARETSRYFAQSQTDLEHDRQMEIRRALVSHGFYEARTLSLMDEKGGYAFDAALHVRNPLTADQTMLRPTLIRGVLAALSNNARAGMKSLRMFEIGRTFCAGEREERTKLALTMTGPISEKSWRAAAERNADFFDLKGILESLGIDGMSFEPMENPALALAAFIKIDGETAGCAGQLLPARAREIDLQNPVVIAELELPTAKRVAKKFREVAKFPAVTRDIAMLAPRETSHAQVMKVLHDVNEPLLDHARLFDLFVDASGEKVEAHQKSLAYSLTYRSAERTLTADEVNAAHARLKERLRAALHVNFRE